jgi:hypothetical protein
VEHGAVVPRVVGARRLPAGDVADDAGVPALRGAETLARQGERLVGEVECGGVVEAVGEPGNTDPMSITEPGCGRSSSTEWVGVSSAHDSVSRSREAKTASQ